MARDESIADERPARGGYALAIIVSALAHATAAIIAFVILPLYMSGNNAEPVAYTVKIVDSIPAGDLGTHLPRLAPAREEPKSATKPVEPAVKTETPPSPPAADTSDNAIALNSVVSPTPTPTPHSTPKPVAASKPALKSPRATPRPEATPSKSRKTPKPAPTVAIAKNETANVSERLADLRRKLMQQHLKDRTKREPGNAADEGDEDSSAPATSGKSSGGGPVAADVASNGRGYGIGSGTGSVGIQQDLDFLLYYQVVQDKIKKAWSYPGGSNDLSATVEFAIGADGSLSACKIGQSSNDTAYDDSVIRAIKGAAPFPSPPEKFRDRFAGGIEAEFKLSELKS